MFLVSRVPGWGRGLTSNVVYRPKIYMADTGLDKASVPFIAGVVVHTGPKRLTFGDRLAAIPLSDIWR